MNKKETLEEDLINSSPQEVKALIRHYKGLYLNYKSIVDRQERSYSDMQDYAIFCLECGKDGIPLISAKEWFEQFKKK